MLRLSSAVRVVPTATGAFLAHYDTGQCFVLNAFGLMVWKHAEKGASRDEICTNIQSEYKDVLPERIQEDVNKFVDELKTRGLIQEVE